MTVFAIAGTVDAEIVFNLQAQVDPYTGNNRYGDVWGDGDYAYVGSFNGSGVAIFDVSAPASTFLAGAYTVASGGQFKDVKVRNGIGYFASDNGGGLHIVDVSNPAAPTLLSQITTSNGGGFNRIHNISVSGNFLYQADSRTASNSTVKVFDISDSSNPFFVRDIVTTDPSRIHDITALGDRLYTSGFGGKTDIYDTSNIGTSDPTLLGSISSGLNSHSSWASTDGNLLVSAREIANGDVRLYDISDPSNPVLLSTITAASLGISAHSPHNVIIDGDRLYISWYQAGLQVLDISDPNNPTRIGYYDTFPGAVSGFDGNWGVYPFLGDDRVLLSDMDGGLFVIAVPEPSGFVLFAISVAAFFSRRKRRNGGS
jgi:choice-of-anchor B domain-containing protein